MKHIEEYKYSLLDKKHLQKVVDADCHELRIIPKLTQAHLDVRGQQRQNVKVAAQTISLSNYCTVERIDLRNKPQAMALKILNDWFDVLNSRRFLQPRPLQCAYGVSSAIQQQEQALTDVETLLKNIINYYEKVDHASMH